MHPDAAGQRTEWLDRVRRRCGRRALADDFPVNQPRSIRVRTDWQSSDSEERAASQSIGKGNDQASDAWPLPGFRRRTSSPASAIPNMAGPLVAVQAVGCDTLDPAAALAAFRPHFLGIDAGGTSSET